MNQFIQENIFRFTKEYINFRNERLSTVTVPEYEMEIKQIEKALKHIYILEYTKINNEILIRHDLRTSR